MARNVGVQHLRGVKANAPTLEAAEFYFATDTNEVLVGTTGGNYLLGTPVFNAAGTRQASCHIVKGTVSLVGGTATVTLVGVAAFTSSASYTVVVTDTTNNSAVQVVQNSGTRFTLNGLTTHALNYICVGN